jgi:hypothetical protein
MSGGAGMLGRCARHGRRAIRDPAREVVNAGGEIVYVNPRGGSEGMP